MDKAIEKLINILPIPLIVLVAGIYSVAWFIKSLKKYDSYGPLFGDMHFRIISFIILLAVSGYYGISFILKNHVPKSFSEKERGVIITQFEADKENKVQKHTVESLISAIYEKPEFSDVKVKGFTRLLEDHEEACTISKSANAQLCIWGVLIPPSTVHYKLSNPNAGREARVMEKDFLDLSNLNEKVISFLTNTPPPAGSTLAQIKYLEKRLEDQLEKNAKNELLIKDLNSKLNNLETEIFGRTEYESEIGKIKLLERSRKRIALLIGVNSYNELPNLRYSANDAQAVGRTISEIWSDNSSAHILLDSDASRYNILKAMDNIARSAKQDDQIWIYFAGHAITENNEGYLIPSDGNPKQLLASAISMNEIRNWFKKLVSNQAIMIADACYSGAFTQFSSRGINSEISISSRLSAIKAAKGRVIITAGGPGELTYEDADLGHGVFSYNLINGLKGEADIDNDGIVTTHELFSFIKDRVVEASSKNGFLQQPAMFSELEGDFVLSIVNSRQISPK